MALSFRAGQYRRYAGHVGTAALGFLGLTLVLVAIRGRFELVSLASLALGVLCGAGWAMLEWGQLRASLRGRTAQYGSASLLLSASVFGIVIVLNVLTNRFYHRFDATADKRYSLSPQTLQVLAQVKEPIQIYSFFSASDTRREEFEQLLQEYLHRCPLLEYRAVDPDTQPGLAKQLGVNTVGAVVFVRGQRKQQIFATQEQDITGALVRVLKDEEPKVYFVTGHQERDPQSYADDGYATIAQALDDEGYTVETLSLAGGEALPADARVIILAAPKQALAPEEEQRLQQYVESGGHLFVLSDPALPAPMGALLSRYGISWRNDLVIDPKMSLLGDAATPLANRYAYSAITRDMQGLTTFFPYARSLQLDYSSKPEAATVLAPVQSSGDSWGEVDLQSGSPRFDEGEDTKGPLVLFVTVEDTGNKARIAVCGDSDFASNIVFSRVMGSGNGDLFLNTVNWLAEEEEVISIRPKPATVRSVLLTPEQGRAIQLVAVVLMPLSVAAAGALVWWRRRA